MNEWMLQIRSNVIYIIVLLRKEKLKPRSMDAPFKQLFNPNRKT